MAATVMSPGIFFITGQWNPKMTMFCVLCVFVFPPHVFAVQLLAHRRVQTSRFFCFLSASADLERPHHLEMAHLPDGRHGYFPQRLPTLSSWVTTCRVQLTLEAFPSETASDPGIATDGHSLPAEHVMPAKQKVFSVGWCVTKPTFYLTSCARTDWTLLQNSTDNPQKMWQLC